MPAAAASRLACCGAGKLDRHPGLFSNMLATVASFSMPGKGVPKFPAKSPAAGTGTCSGMGDAVAVGGHQHSAVSVFAEFDRGGDGDLRTEIVSLEGYERRSADFVARCVKEQNRITRKIVVFWTFRYRREGQGSAGIGLLRRNRQAQGDIEKNSFLTRHGLASRLANTFA